MFASFLYDSFVRSLPVFHPLRILTLISIFITTTIEQMTIFVYSWNNSYNNYNYRGVISLSSISPPFFAFCCPVRMNYKYRSVAHYLLTTKIVSLLHWVSTNYFNSFMIYAIEAKLQGTIRSIVEVFLLLLLYFKSSMMVLTNTIYIHSCWCIQANQ